MTAATLTSTDVDTARQSLDTLFGLFVNEAALITVWTLADHRAKFFDNVDGASRYALSRASKSDVYFGVALYRSGISHGRGKADDIVAITSLWADIDFHTPGIHDDQSLPRTIDDALSILDRLPLKASLVVNTGHGSQAFWLLKEPITPQEGAGELARQWGLTLATFADAAGWKYDTGTSDLTRLLRVPGTFNRKSGVKPVTLVSGRCDESRRYDVDDVQQFVASARPDVPEHIRVDGQSSHEGRLAAVAEVGGRFEIRPDLPSELPTVMERLVTSDLEFSRLWNFGRPDFGGDCSRYLLSLADFGVSLSWTNQQIVDAMTYFQDRWRSEVNESRPVDRHDLPWYVRTLYKARFERTTPGGHPSRSSGRALAQRASGTAQKAGLTKQLADAIVAADDFAQDAGHELYVYDSGVYKPGGAEYVRRRVKRLLEEANQTAKWSRRRNEEVVEYVRLDAPPLVDRPPLETLNVANGLFCVDTRELRPHSPEFLSPVQLPVHYDPDATCPKWEQFVSEVFPSDARVIAWELPAWLMTPDTSIQKAVLLLGEGANAKSTYLRALTVFLGPYNVSGVGLHTLEIDRFATSRLVGKLANICPDLPSSHLANTSTFKALAGGDRIAAERKFRESFEFSPFARLVFSANHPPRSYDASEAFFRRWVVIPFANRFEGERAIPSLVLDARLGDKAELSGVLNKALDALPGLIDSGFTESTSMRAAFDEFREATDPVATWLDVNTVEYSESLVAKKDLVDAYNAACVREGRPGMTGNAFGRSMRRLRPKITDGQRTVNGRPKTPVWLGMGLKQSDAVGDGVRL